MQVPEQVQVGASCCGMGVWRRWQYVEGSEQHQW